MEELVISLIQIINNIPYGMICFFPSYDFCNSLINYIKNSKYWNEISKIKSIFYDKQNSSNSNSFEYYKII